MERFKLYQHILNVDTAIFPKWVQPKEGGLEVKVKWFNVSNPSNPTYLGLTETIFITEAQIPNWLPWEPNVIKN